MFRKFVLLASLCLAVACSSSSSDGEKPKQGDLDWTFGMPDGYVLFEGWNRDSYVGLAIQANGRIVVSTGVINDVDAEDVNVGVLRYDTDGNPDNTFGDNGLVLWDSGHGKDCGRSNLIDGQDKIVVTGYTRNGDDYDVLLMRLDPDGTLDDSFGTGGIVRYDNNRRNDYGRGIALQGDGKIIVTARSTGEGTSQALLLRFEGDGTLDASFGENGAVIYERGGGNDGFRDLVLQGDGKIVVAGYSRTEAGFEILTGRFNTDGSLDRSFGTEGIALYDGGHGSAGARGVDMLSDRRIVVSGTNDNGADLDVVVLMYDVNGWLDSGFGTDGVVIYDRGQGNDNGRKLAIQSDDRIVVAGNTWNGNDYDALVLRYHSDGTADTVFGSGGAAVINLGDGNEWGETVAIQTDQNIIVAGGMDRESDAVLTMRLIGASFPFN